jgi:hypothetical protein
VTIWESRLLYVIGHSFAALPSTSGPSIVLGGTAGSYYTTHQDHLFDLLLRNERRVQNSQENFVLVDTLAWSNRTVHEMVTDIQIVTGHHMTYPAIASHLGHEIVPSFRPSQSHHENRHGQYRFDRERHGWCCRLRWVLQLRGGLCREL